jgi:hypothetical protein
MDNGPVRKQVRILIKEYKKNYNLLSSKKRLELTDELFYKLVDISSEIVNELAKFQYDWNCDSRGLISCLHERQSLEAEFYADCQQDFILKWIEACELKESSSK